MKEEKQRHNLTKTGLRIIGILLALGGLTCTIIGSIDLFTAISEGAGLPKLFFLLMIGLPMLTIGVAMLMFGFRREIGTYLKDETMPVAVEAGKEFAPAAAALAAAANPAAQDAAAESTCPKCGAKNPAALHFCEMCGTPLTKTCPACGKTVRADAAFCGHCGKKFD